VLDIHAYPVTFVLTLAIPDPNRDPNHEGEPEPSAAHGLREPLCPWTGHGSQQLHDAQSEKVTI